LYNRREQLTPQPEATEYQTQIIPKEQAGKVERAQCYDLRLRFWTDFLKTPRTKVNLLLQKRQPTGSWS
jgi:hypothetical protein